jgi:mRNA-degrading endonuclease YafQ of YafQ-DinJ toxin-antitoxin module
MMSELKRMLKIEYSNKMKRDAKRMQRRGKDMQKLFDILSILARQEQLSGALLKTQNIRG